MPDSKIGDLLIRSRLITAQQFAQALELQKQNPDQQIGKLLVQLGYLQESVLKEFLDFMGKRQKLGEILLRQQLIDKTKLNNALLVSQDENIPLGRALLKLHYIEEGRLAQTIAQQYDLPFFTLDRFSFDPELAKFINYNYAQTHRVVAVSRYEKILTLAMAFPLSYDEIREVEVASGMKVNPVISTERDITIAQERIYRTQYEPTPQKQEEQVKFEISEDGQFESEIAPDQEGPDTDYLVNEIITHGLRLRASDIHFECTEHGMQVRFRIDGVLQHLDMGKDAPAINNQAKQIISRVKIICDMDIAEKRRPQDSSFKMKVTKDGNIRRVDFRVSTIPTQYGENVVIRILDRRGLPASLESLRLAPYHMEVLTQELAKPTGMFLVTGPTGSGKSTTLYAILSKLNTPGSKTVTVEDPIEYSIDGVCQSEVNDVVGNTFAKLLRSFLRQDPDNIMVGEIRDLETGSIAVRAALTGHTVLSTLHTNDATSAVVRLLDMGLEPTLISSTLRCVISQRLVRTICTKCKEKRPPSDQLKREFLISADVPVTFQYGKGCMECNHTGYLGRMPIIELWAPTREETLFLHKRPDNITLRERVFDAAKRHTMVEDGLIRVKQGLTTLDELLRVVPSEGIAEFRDRYQKKLFSWDD